MRVQSLASLCGLRIWHCHGLGLRSGVAEGVAVGVAMGVAVAQAENKDKTTSMEIYKCRKKGTDKQKEANKIFKRKKPSNGTITTTKKIVTPLPFIKAAGGGRVVCLPAPPSAERTPWTSVYTRPSLKWGQGRSPPPWVVVRIKWARVCNP